jgi:hypothetical protein
LENYIKHIWTSHKNAFENIARNTFGNYIKYIETCTKHIGKHCTKHIEKTTQNIWKYNKTQWIIAQSTLETYKKNTIENIVWNTLGNNELNTLEHYTKHIENLHETQWKTLRKTHWRITQKHLLISPNASEIFTKHI